LLCKLTLKAFDLSEESAPSQGQLAQL
jgi:hypothetical protein